MQSLVLLSLTVPALMEKWSVEELLAQVSALLSISIFNVHILSLTLLSIHPCPFLLCLVYPSLSYWLFLSLTCVYVCLSVDCGWSSWTQWSACSRTCDVGVRRRYRSGTNPPPAFGGRPCKGDRVGIDTCSIEPCFG